MTTTPPTEVDLTDLVDVDLSDLDLLNPPDKYRHARCPKCYPRAITKWGMRYLTLCGMLRIWRSKDTGVRWRPDTPPPPDACPDCVRMPSCPKCGYMP